MKETIKIQGVIVKVEPAKTGYCYTLKEHETNKQYFFFNTWKLDIAQGVAYAFSLQAKSGRDKYYLLLLSYKNPANQRKKKAYKRVVDQQERTNREQQQLKAINKHLKELTERQKWEIKDLKRLLETKQREIDNKPEYQAQNVFDQLARIYYKSNRNAAERQLLSEVNNLFNDTYLGKE
jgi:predicted transcriptional regulator